MNFDELEQRYNLPPGMLNAVMQTESNGNANAVSPVGARGAFQFMPATAKAYGLTDPHDTAAAADAAARYLADSAQRYGTNDPRVLAAEYNGGPRQAKAVLAGREPAAAETRDYIPKVTGKMDINKALDALPDISQKPAGKTADYASMIDALPDLKGSSYESEAKGEGTGRNVLASIGGAMYGPVLGAKRLLGMGTPEEVKQYKDSMSGLWSTPGGKVGTVVGGIAAAAPAAVMAGPSSLGVGAVGAGMGALRPVDDGESRLLNTALGAGGGVAGKYAGELLGKGLSGWLDGRVAGLATTQAQNAVRDATIKEAQAAGYSLPPTQINPANPGVINSALEGFSGKIQTAQKAGIKNQEITDSLAKQALGVPDNVPLTNSTLDAIRSQAGEAYKAVAQAGPIRADQQFGRDVSGIVSNYRQVAKDFPSQANPQIESLLADISKPGFDSKSAVELIKRLRSSGFDNIRGNQEPATKALGQVQIGVQNAMEDLIDRNLAAKGMNDLVPAYQQARQLIAKSYTVQNALEDSTGKVVASKIGRDFTKGRPLTGELATIGRTAEAFPRALQNVNSSMPGISPRRAALLR